MILFTQTLTLYKSFTYLLTYLLTYLHSNSKIRTRDMFSLQKSGHLEDWNTVSQTPHRAVLPTVVYYGTGTLLEHGDIVRLNTFLKTVAS